MRVIAGSAKGVQLQPVPGRGTRPISDRVKAALFDTLGTSVIGARVLDLFAGTGSVGIEALSRGAERVVFVEQHPVAAATIQGNLQRARLHARGHIAKVDVFKFLGREGEPFDLIYVAPPQYQGLWSKTLLALDAAPIWLQPEGVIVIQVFPKEWKPLSLDTLGLADRRQYGSTLLCFYEPEG